MIPIRTFTVSPVLPTSIGALKELAYNYWWMWDADARELFARIDRKLWSQVRHNPVKLLGIVSQDRLLALSNDGEFVNFVDRVYRRFTDYMNRPLWYQTSGDMPQDKSIVYFCAEFGVHESFPNYSGGLGALAGDHLKSASDLGIPLLGVGLLYQQGYFHQYLTQDGWQNESYVDNDFFSMPLTLVKDSAGQPIEIDVDLPDGKVYARIWKVAIGRAPLYLMDTNIPKNAKREHRDITNQLYGGDVEMRITQEIMLGIGGVRLLRALDIHPSVFHINEGHAAFSALERIRLTMQDKGLDFYSAMEIVRAGNVFTTHTPVPAGNEVFSLDLIDKYFSKYLDSLGISKEEMFAFGRIQPSNGDEEFGMTVLGLRMSAYRNGVSRLHGETARTMWRDVWSDYPVEEVPIGSVSNGIHTLSWAAKELAELYDRYLSPMWRTDTSNPAHWEATDSIPNEELWRVHERRRERLIIYARNHIRNNMKRFATPDQISRVKDMLNPDTLTIGLARRFATYKRANLLFSDMKRLAAMMLRQGRPVQLIIAGKAHPHDTPAKQIIKNIIHQIREFGLDRSIVFLEDYDLASARMMVKGCDIWLNTPRRPHEASGTSGMKAALNGCLHVSTLDGWWDESYNGNNGFAIGSGEVYNETEEDDAIEREALFELLENEIIPTFYDRSLNNVPERWVEMMKESIKTIAPYFSTARMLQEYTEQFYIPGMHSVGRLRESDGERAKALRQWKNHVARAWNSISIHEVSLRNFEDVHVGKPVQVSALIDLGSLSPDDIVVEAYFGSVDSQGHICDAQTIALDLQRSNDKISMYEGTFAAADSGLQGCTVRILPRNADMIRHSDLYLCKWAS